MKWRNNHKPRLCKCLCTLGYCGLLPLQPGTTSCAKIHRFTNIFPKKIQELHPHHHHPLSRDPVLGCCATQAPWSAAMFQSWEAGNPRRSSSRWSVQLVQRQLWRRFQPSPSFAPRPHPHRSWARCVPAYRHVGGWAMDVPKCYVNDRRR